MNKNVVILIYDIINNQYIIDKINYYLIYTYQLDHIPKYNLVLKELHYSIRYLKTTFDYFICDNYYNGYRVGRFNKEWDLKLNYPGFYDKFASKIHCILQ